MIKTIYATLLVFLYSIAAADETNIIYPDFQYGFMKIVAEYAQKYKAADNELKKSALVTERISSFEKLKGNPRKIAGWIGVIETMGTNSEGKAFVSIILSPNLVKVSTWSNEFSDISDNSLIPQKSTVFSRLSELKPGNVVKFSGRLKRAKNMTEAGKMLQPDFLFVFTSIEKLGDRATPK